MKKYHEEAEMQDVEGEAVTHLRYCYAICIEWLPEEVIRADENLCRLVKSGGKCFARIMRRASWNTVWVCIAADPRHLGDEKRSHLVEVSTSALPVDIGADTLMAAAIPHLLLDEDVELRHTAEENSKCPAFIEQQLSWDLYRVRIASDVHYLHHKERSHVIYFSQDELLTYMGVPSEQERSGEATSVPAAAARPAPQKPVELTRLEPVQVSEEDLKAAVDTMDIPEDLLSVQAQRHGSKSWQRWKQLLELILYRAVLRALSHKKVMQEIIRRVLVARKRFSKRLIRINDMYEKDGHIYWTIQVDVPPSLI